MKVIKNYTAIQLKTETVNDNVNVKLSYGRITGPYYSVTHPKEIFDSEVEATEYAYKTDKWGKWLVLPIISFDNFDDI